ncbi:MAG TPA: hypothetical protein VF392_12520 [Terracidiphilus sp.]
MTRIGSAILAALLALAPSLLHAQQSSAASRKTVTFYPLDAAEAPSALKAAPRTLPTHGVTAVLNDSGAVWTGTPEGVVRTASDGDAQFLASPRYLPDNDVRALAADGAGGVWVRTATGIAHIDYRPLKLDAKALELEQVQSQRHFRYGLVADAILDTPGSLAHTHTGPSDNDGLWTAMYAAGECFRYAADRSPEALARAKTSLEAVLFLTTISGIPGYPARSFVHKGEALDGDVDRWHDASDPRYRWKGDTSSDEIVGHFFLYATAYDLLPDEALHKRIAVAVEGIMDHILDHGYYLIGETGKPTTWGRWSPEYLSTPGGRPDGPLNAIELLSFLKVAAHITHDPRYDAEYQKVAYQMGYAELGARYLELREEINYSDEELFMLAIYPLMTYEKDAKLLALYQRALDQWWQNEQRERNPLWAVIYQRCTQGAKADLAPAFARLAEYPLNRINWTVKNSARADVPLDGGLERDGCRQTTVLLPLDELPIRRWNSSPFCVDGGEGGREEAEGTTFLLPYWMARAFKLIGER